MRTLTRTGSEKAESHSLALIIENDDATNAKCFPLLLTLIQ